MLLDLDDGEVMSMFNTWGDRRRIKKAVENVKKKVERSTVNVTEEHFEWNENQMNVKDSIAHSTEV